MSNFTFNTTAHQHGMQVTYNFVDLTSEISPVYVVRTGIIPAARAQEVTIAANKSNLTSVVFSNVVGDGTAARQVYIDDLDVTVVPEPSALLSILTVLAGAGLILRRHV